MKYCIAEESSCCREQIRGSVVVTAAGVELPVAVRFDGVIATCPIGTSGSVVSDVDGGAVAWLTP